LPRRGVAGCLPGCRGVLTVPGLPGLLPGLPGLLPGLLPGYCRVTTAGLLPGAAGSTAGCCRVYCRVLPGAAGKDLP